ncbi:E3 ubiquitin-protein ligase RNF6 [Gouania willdenowi]|uniref:RING-type E3 ubiquitin transferase n=1 Tax=Gouania willdenowi TaxID=441366 RepID=A0A8C5GL28_GOUWI|nr:E3 ubiquitin-protein ligase RNF6 [Gouania willdenowi]
MEPPGGGDERRRQAERLRREEAYYHFINDLSEEEYRLMRDGNLLGTPGEVTAEELQQRLDGAKERVSSQPDAEQRVQMAEAGEQQSSSGEGEERGPAVRRGTGAAEGGASESSNGDSLLEWLNTFRRTGNATRSGQSGNQTWRAVSRTNPNSGEFRFSLEININHDQPEPGEHNDSTETAERPPSAPNTATSSVLTSSSFSTSRLSATSRPTPYPSPRPAISRRMQTRRMRSSSTALPLSTQVLPPPVVPQRRSANSHSLASDLNANVPPPDQSTPLRHQAMHVEVAQERNDASVSTDCPRVSPQLESAIPAAATHEPRGSRTRSRGRVRRVAALTGVSSRASRRSRSPLHRTPVPSASPPSNSVVSTPPIPTIEPGSSTTSAVSVETGEAGTGEPVVQTERAVETVEQEGESHGTGTGSSAVRRHPTIMLDLQVRRIRPGENRDRDSIASRTRSRARVAENTVTFESDSGGFRRTISRSERAGIRTYVSTIRIPLRRISETGLGEPNSTALRSILRQIMTGFGELSSLMETEADSESIAPNHADASGTNSNANLVGRLHTVESPPAQLSGGNVVQERMEMVGIQEEPGAQARLVAGAVNSTDSRATSRDTNNLVENGTLPILRLAHFFLLNDEEDDEHPRGLTKEQIDNLSTRTYDQASVEGEVGRACSVCINEYTQGNKLRRLPCSHEFHIHCIDRWLSENNTCPICRQPILAAHHD